MLPLCYSLLIKYFPRVRSFTLSLHLWYPSLPSSGSPSLSPIDHPTEYHPSIPPYWCVSLPSPGSFLSTVRSFARTRPDSVSPHCISPRPQLYLLHCPLPLQCYSPSTCTRPYFPCNPRVSSPSTDSDPVRVSMRVTLLPREARPPSDLSVGVVSMVGGREGLPSLGPSPHRRLHVLPVSFVLYVVCGMGFSRDAVIFERAEDRGRSARWD